ncbi:MAG: hypothetical protein WBG86_10105, partial [Polyangiales bacterium]
MIWTAGDYTGGPEVLHDAPEPKIVPAMRMAVMMAALWLCAAATVRAQSADWIVLPTTTEENAPWMGPTAGNVGRALRRQGVGVWSSGGAVA